MESVEKTVLIGPPPVPPTGVVSVASGPSPSILSLSVPGLMFITSLHMECHPGTTSSGIFPTIVLPASNN